MVKAVIQQASNIRKAFVFDHAEVLAVLAAHLAANGEVLPEGSTVFVATTDAEGTTVRKALNGSRTRLEIPFMESPPDEKGNVVRKAIGGKPRASAESSNDAAPNEAAAK